MAHAGPLPCQAGLAGFGDEISRAVGEVLVGTAHDTGLVTGKKEGGVSAGGFAIRWLQCVESSPSMGKGD